MDRNGSRNKPQEVFSSKRRRKEIVFELKACTPNDCLDSLVSLCQEMLVGLSERYEDIIPDTIKNLGEIFDLESEFGTFCSFWHEDGKLKMDRDSRSMRKKNLLIFSSMYA